MHIHKFISSHKAGKHRFPLNTHTHTRANVNGGDDARISRPLLAARLGWRAEQFTVQSGRLEILSILTTCEPPAPRTRPPSFDTISRSHCGRLAFTFFPPLHLNCSLGVCSCSHERALQSQMCEETVSKLGFCLSKFSSCTRCLWQMGLRLWFEFQSRATNKFHRRPPPPKVPSGTKRSVTIFDNEIETETFVLNSVISKPQTSLKWGELKEYSEITTSVDRRHNGRAASPLLTLFA